MVFQATRHIVTALMQKIVYGEWLPLILGKQFVEDPKNKLDLPIKGTEYDPSVNPSIENGFATAAFRFGHSMIQGIFDIIDHKTKKVKSEFLRDNLFENKYYFDPEKRVDGTTNIILGLTQQKAQKNDASISEDLTNFLFMNGKNHGQAQFDQRDSYTKLLRRS